MTRKPKKISKDLIGELALAVRTSITCIEQGILPGRKSPFQHKLKQLYLAYKRKVKP